MSLFYRLLMLLGVLCLKAAFALESRTITLDNKTFRLLEVPVQSLNLHWQNADGKAYGSMVKLKKSLANEGKTVLAMMNAGIYSHNDVPAGLHVENGTILKTLNTNKGQGNFHLQPNGVFLLSKAGQASIVTTADYQQHYAGNEKALKLATQSGPMLLINGKINRKFLPNSPSEYSRNGICTTAKGKVYFLATDAFPAVKSNLYQFASAAQQIGCDNALYLDGSISKLYVNGEDATFHFPRYVGLFSVLAP